MLRALPPSELGALAARMGIALDDKKRIDPAAQVARALVRLPDVREPARLPPASAMLLFRIAAAGGLLSLPALPPGLDVLAFRGIVYARLAESGVELILPTAFLVQLRPWEGEDPRSVRALLAEAPFETASAIASHYLGRPSTPPVALSLEPAWEALSTPARLRAEIEQVAHEERRLLDAIERQGGEVDSGELMDLEREPMRVRGAVGVASGRRGAAFALEKRGLLFPVHPNRHVVPAEVGALVGAERRRQRAERRERIRGRVLAHDYLPRRARFCGSPAPLAVAMAMVVSESPGEVRLGVGTPRSLLTRLAQRFGREVEPTGLLAALSRAVGLWEDPALGPAAPPWSLRLDELGRALFDAWRAGAAWDEARPEPETLRVASEHRDASPARNVRDMVLGALHELGEGRWVPCDALLQYLDEDPRTVAIERLFARWSARVGLTPPTLLEVAQRIILGSLPALGVVDVGEDDVDSPEAEPSVSGLAVRLTARGRGYLGAAAAAARAPGLATSEFAEPQVLSVGEAAVVGAVIDLAPFADASAVDPRLELSFPPTALARGLAAGIDPEEMRRRIAVLATPTEPLGRTLDQASAVLGKGTLVATGGFLWVDNDEVRELLRTRTQSADLFLDPSPPAGLLVAPGVEPERLVRRCRALGVEIDVEERVWRARRQSSRPPPRTSLTTHRSASWRPTGGRSGSNPGTSNAGGGSAGGSTGSG